MATHFKERKIPFIAGAAGTIEYLLIWLLFKGDFTKYELEIIMLFHAARLIIHGHHSLLEVLVVTQAAYLFDELPSIIKSAPDEKFYEKFIGEFSNYIATKHRLNGVRLARFL